MCAIRLAPNDNIVVLARRVAAGDAVAIDGLSILIDRSLDLGHKVAVRPIAAGEKIIKYCVPIGSATTDIHPGEHVHLHNMKSDYLPTYTLDEEHLFGERP
ncbi:MAG: UxaA family hydrolase [Planctomycetaceae bacterium]